MVPCGSHTPCAARSFVPYSYDTYDISFASCALMQAHAGAMQTLVAPAGTETFDSAWVEQDSVEDTILSEDASSSTDHASLAVVESAAANSRCAPSDHCTCNSAVTDQCAKLFCV